MTIRTLTHAQQSQRDKFNARTLDESHDIDLIHYEKPRFGPWCPYWTVYSRIAQRVRPGSRLLVVGCGTGRDALIYAKLGYRVDGIDISDGSVGIANNMARKYELAGKAAFHAQPAERLEFEDQAFDAVVGINVLHHADIKASVRETHRVLKPGCRAIFKEPLSTPVRDFIRNRPPVTWLVPKGIKNRTTGELYLEELHADTSDEHLLTASDFKNIREIFGNLKITRFHVLAKLSSLFGRRPMLERWDHRLFKFLPPARLLGDQVVLEMQKK